LFPQLPQLSESVEMSGLQVPASVVSAEASFTPNGAHAPASDTTSTDDAMARLVETARREKSSATITHLHPIRRPPKRRGPFSGLGLFARWTPSRKVQTNAVFE
jgi:hypothetical protein